MDLENKDIGYILSSDIKGLSSYLYSRGYRILELKEYYQGAFQNFLLAWSNNPNQEVKKESLDIIRNFNQEYIIFKEINQLNIKKTSKKDPEKYVDIIMYNTDSENKSYIYEGVSFSFIERPTYTFPKNKEDFKNGMIIECYSTNGWISKMINNVDSEYENIYKTLSKYNKVRIIV